MVKIVRTLDNNKRRLFLFIASLWHVSYGLLYMFSPSPPSKQAGFNWLPYGVDENEASWFWILSGAIAGIIALYPKKRTKAENVAFGLLLIPAFIWVIVYLISFFVLGNSLGIFQAFQFSWVWMIVYVSGWSNPILVHLEIDEVTKDAD